MRSRDLACSAPGLAPQVIVLSNFDFGAAQNAAEFLRARLPMPVR